MILKFHYLFSTRCDSKYFWLIIVKNSSFLYLKKKKFYVHINFFSLLDPIFPSEKNVCLVRDIGINGRQQRFDNRIQFSENLLTGSERIEYIYGTYFFNVERVKKK